MTQDTAGQRGQRAVSHSVRRYKPLTRVLSAADADAARDAVPVSSNFVSQSELIDAEPETHAAWRWSVETLFDATSGSVSAQSVSADRIAVLICIILAENYRIIII